MCPTTNLACFMVMIQMSSPIFTTQPIKPVLLFYPWPNTLHGNTPTASEALSPMIMVVNLIGSRFLDLMGLGISRFLGLMTQAVNSMIGRLLGLMSLIVGRPPCSSLRTRLITSFTHPSGEVLTVGMTIGNSHFLYLLIHRSGPIASRVAS